MRYPLLLVVGAVLGGLSCAPSASLTAPTDSTADRSDSARVTANGTPAASSVGSVRLSATTATLTGGDTVTLTANVFDAAGAAMSGQTVTWATSNAGVATVKAATATGALVTAIAAGTVVVTATSGGKAATTAVTITAASMGAGVQAAWSDAFVESIGVNTHLGYTDEPYGTAFSADVLNLLVGAGVRHIRDGGYGTNSTSQPFTNHLNVLGAAGIKVLYGMGDFERSGGTAWGNAPSATAFVANVTTYINPSYLAGFEGYNEPNGNNVSAATTLAGQHALYAAVKAYEPAMEVYGPPLSGGHGQSAINSFIADMAGIGVYMDHPTAHPYAGGQLPAVGFPGAVSQLAIEASGKSPAFTELGYVASPAATDGQPSIDQATQAKYTLRTYLEAWNAGVVRSYIYEWIDEQNSPTTAEANFGLVLNNGTPKPAYTALKNLIALVADPGSAPTPSKLAFSLGSVPSTVHYALFQKRSGTFVLVIWNEVLSYNVSTKADITNAPVAATLTLGGTFSQVQQFSPVAASSAQQTWSKVSAVPLSITDAPMVLQITQ